ncbi:MULTISPECIES: hypothetical protein [unclassified Staphylococcus]|uniref:hypothetical protein n=1 Tax=unclassified Staphylococcus TaxID=91994 RepID=UPI001AEBE825|nr:MULTISPECIES: hypothetical protein [unclassified Staphylococcus]
MSDIDEMINNLFDNENSSNNKKPISTGKTSINPPDNVHEVFEELQEKKKITMQKKTEILKALSKGEATSEEILEKCIECIGSAVSDKAFFKQAQKDYQANYKKIK